MNFSPGPFPGSSGCEDASRKRALQGLEAFTDGSGMRAEVFDRRSNESGKCRDDATRFVEVQVGAGRRIGVGEAEFFGSRNSSASLQRG